MDKMISVAIPCYRSEKTIPVVVADLQELFQTNQIPYQIVLVNDGSPDHTFQVIRKLAQQDHHVVSVNLSKNYGQHSARMAAIPFLKGDYIVYMDDDGQHPVSAILPMLQKLEDGDYDVVYAQFQHKKHSAFKRLVSRINTATLNFLAGKPKGITNSSFSIMRAYVAKELVKYKSPFPSWTGFVMQITHNVANLPVEHVARISGQSNYTLKRMLRLYLNSMFGFSIVPLRLSSAIGAICAFAGFLTALYCILQKLFHSSIPVGYTSLISVILIVGGLIMLMLGLVGEYVGRIYMINSNMPQYTIREVVEEEKDG